VTGLRVPNWIRSEEGDRAVTKAQVLVVEDESIVALSIRYRLRSLGYFAPVVACSGEEAIEKAAEMRPDLVLMDIHLQGNVDGIEAAEEIRARFDIPVVYLTAYADDNTLQRAKITEPFGYITKPFEEENLRTSIEIALYKHRMERRLRESERWLAATLRSIGDAVIATDARGCVRFMNPVAEALVGWKQEDASGQDVKDVFNVVDEQTHVLAESPVTKALREGIVVGAVNQILVAKDARETFVDSSSAPVRDERGDIIGAVLVFRDVTERKRAERGHT